MQDSKISPCWWECTVTLEYSLAIFCKVKHTSIKQTSNRILWYLSKWLKNLHPQGEKNKTKLYTNIYNVFIYTRHLEWANSETERSIEVTKGWRERGMRSYYLMGAEFQFGMMKEFWKWILVTAERHGECTYCYEILYLKIVKAVNFV